ncbi:MAG: hypothetical protein WBN81_13970 [Gammaproteobacteria bacterium]
MNKFCTTTLVVPVLIVMCLTCAAQPVSAGVEAECSQEAEDFDVMPELRDDYIAGCIDSRGGTSISDNAEEDYVPPSEFDEMNNPEEDSDDATE